MQWQGAAHGAAGHTCLLAAFCVAGRQGSAHEAKAAKAGHIRPTCGAMRAKMRSMAPGCAANSLNSCSSSMLRRGKEKDTRKT